MPPPLKVLALALVRLIVPVPVTVAFVDVFMLKAVLPLPLTVNVPDPNASVLIFALLEANKLTVVFFPLASNVPLVNVSVLPPMLKSSCSFQVPPTPSKTIGKFSVLPEVVIVLGVLDVEANVNIEDELDTVIPEDRLKSPKTLTAPVDAHVPAYPVKIAFLQT